jgi:hypothetical protein
MDSLWVSIVFMILLLLGLAWLVRRSGTTTAKGEHIPPMTIPYVGAWIVLCALVVGYQHVSYYGQGAWSGGMILETINAALFGGAFWGWIFWRFVGLHKRFGKH